MEEQFYFVSIYYAHGVTKNYIMTQEQADLLKTTKVQRTTQIIQYGDANQAMVDHEYTCHIDISPVAFKINNDKKLEDLQKYGVTSV